MKSKFHTVGKPISVIISLVMVLALAAGVIPAQAAPQQIILFTNCAASNTIILEADCDALMDLYTATTGASWTNTVAVDTIWGPGGDADPCTWYGVTCNTSTPKRVTQIGLYGNNLDGSLPASIGDLTALTNLDLGFNYITGALPTSIENFTNLKYLTLSNNLFTGSIPTEIGNVNSLVDLELESSGFTGSTIPTSIGNLTNLTYLSLSGNGFTGSIPASLGNLTALTNLHLGDNSLTGSIPEELGNLTEVYYLTFWDNTLSGNIPSTFGNLTKLKYLHLENNSLTGSIPPELGNLPVLQRLMLYNNQLSGPIPPELGNLPVLQQLLLYNNQLSGPIPPELGNLSALQQLELNNNLLSGHLPKELAGDTALTKLTLNNNPDLYWTIPLEFTALTLGELNYIGTSLCAPNDAGFTAWLGTIPLKGTNGLTCDPIFADGFESGDTSAWSGAVGANIPQGAYTAEALCKLCVNTLSAQVNTYGLKVRVPDKKPHFLTDTSPTAETRYRARFYVNIKTLKMSNNNNFKILMGRSDTTAPFFVQVRKYGLKYQIRAAIRTNGGTMPKTAWVLLPKKSVPVEIDWMASDNLVTPNGYIELFVNNVSKASKTGIANDTHVIETVRLGLTSKIKLAFNISGYFLLDAFTSDKTTYMGP